MISTFLVMAAGWSFSAKVVEERVVFEHVPAAVVLQKINLQGETLVPKGVTMTVEQSANAIVFKGEENHLAGIVDLATLFDQVPIRIKVDVKAISPFFDKVWSFAYETEAGVVLDLNLEEYGWNQRVGIQSKREGGFRVRVGAGIDPIDYRLGQSGPPLDLVDGETFIAFRTFESAIGASGYLKTRLPWNELDLRTFFTTVSVDLGPEDPLTSIRVPRNWRETANSFAVAVRVAKISD